MQQPMMVLVHLRTTHSAAVAHDRSRLICRFSSALASNPTARVCVRARVSVWLRARAGVVLACGLMIAVLHGQDRNAAGTCCNMVTVISCCNMVTVISCCHTWHSSLGWALRTTGRLVECVHRRAGRVGRGLGDFRSWIGLGPRPRRSLPRRGCVAVRSHPPHHPSRRGCLGPPASGFGSHCFFPLALLLLVRRHIVRRRRTGTAAVPFTRTYRHTHQSGCCTALRCAFVWRCAWAPSLRLGVATRLCVQGRACAVGAVVDDARI